MDKSPLDGFARALIDQVPEYLALLDLSGKIVDLNQAARTAADAAGNPGAGRFRGLPLWHTLPWSTSPATAAVVRSCFEQAARGEPARRDIDGLGPEGTKGSTVELSIVLLPAKGEQPAYLLVQSRDATSRRTAEMKLEIVRGDRDALMSQLRTLEPAMRVPISASAPAPSAPMHTPPSESSMRPASAGPRPRVLVVEDNPEMNRFLSEALSRLFDVDSALDGAAGLERALAAPPDLILTDLMMPKLSGDLLLREVRSRAELDGIPIVVLTGNSDDELRVRLLREGAQDFLAKPFSAKELLVRVGNLVDVKRAREVLREEAASQSRDLESLARALTTKTRQLAGALEAAREAQERAERAGEAKNLFLSVASHELRTPLAALQLRIDRLRRSTHPLNSPEHADTFRGVQSAIGRLTMLVESLVQYANLHSKVMPVTPATFDVGKMVDEVVAGARPSAELKGLALHYERPAKPVSLETDPALFRTVVANLVDNAIKFTSKGRIEVSVHAVADSVRVDVGDTGPGVHVNDRSRIFEPFAHLESADRKHTPGVGLGLALVREVMHVLTGSVELQSEVGAGSTFSVTLPRAQTPQTRDG